MDIEEIEKKIKEMTADQLRTEVVAAYKYIAMLDKIHHDQITANQAAWIEWQHGRGAEEAMRWIHNGLWGPGLIPDEGAPYSKEAQAWMDANRAEPMPQCACGRPSHILWMGHGACCNEHYEEARAKHGEVPA